MAFRSKLQTQHNREAAKMRGAISDDDSAHSSGDEGLAELAGLSAQE